MLRIKSKLSSNLFSSILTARLYSLILYIQSIPWRFKSFFYCHIAFSAKIIGWKNISFGRNVVVSGGSWINVNKRNLDNVKRVTIGDNTFIGRYNFFTLGNSIVLGPYCLTASNCSFIGSSHNIENPLQPYISTGVTDSNDIVVGTNCFFGYGSSVIGNVKIGHGCIIGANCVVLSDIPPFSIVIGNPGVVIKRFDFSQNKWVNAFDDLIDGPNEVDYLKVLEDNLNNKFPFMPLSVSNDFFGDAP